jgi:hypothetical protein
MQLKALTAIVSIALTVGVHAVPNPVDRAAGVNDVLKRSHSHGIDISKRQDPGSFAKEWLDAFNSVREESGALPVTWNGGLATVAGEWITACKYGPRKARFGEFTFPDASGLGLTPLKAVEAWRGGYSLANSPQ